MNHLVGRRPWASAFIAIFVMPAFLVFSTFCAAADNQPRPPRIVRSHDVEKRRAQFGAHGPKASVPEPPTVALGPEQARAVLEEDWLYQGEGKPLVERSRSEVQWCRDIMRRLRSRRSPVDVQTERAELEKLSAELNKIEEDPDQAQAMYLRIRELKRRLMFKHPEVDFDRILLVDIPYPHGGEWQHETTYRSGALAATPGGRLLVIEGLGPGAKPGKIAPKSEAAAFLRPDLSFDAKRVVFCMKPASERAYHLYEANLATGAIRQITDGLYDDLDPIYLPDGGFAFVTNRANGYIGCGPWWMSAILARCDRDGSNIYFISHSNGEAEYSPALLPDGRILYTRWEYNDKYIQLIQSLWTVNPDGTQQNTCWGNQSHWPNHLGEGRPIPGSNKVVFTGLGHHDVFSGSLGLVDIRRGMNYPHGLEKITADRQWPDGGDGPTPAPTASSRYHTAGEFAAYKSPYPLSEDLFLVSMRCGVVRDDGTFVNSGWPQAAAGLGFFDLYLMDIDGNRELIYRGAANVVYAQPVRPRKTPPVLSSTVVWPGKKGDGNRVVPGVFYSADVRQGLPEDVRKRVRYLRVIENVHRSYSVGMIHGGGGAFRSDDHSAFGRFEDVPEAFRKHSWWSWRAKDPSPSNRHPGYRGNSFLNAGPATSLLGNTSIKRVLGTVPVQDDGSVTVKVPPAKSVYFQVLDSEYRALQTMRSWVSVMPGEKRGCLGCHQTSYRTPELTGQHPLVFRREPLVLQPPPYGVKTISYVRDVQPVLDRHCVSCHRPGEPGGKALDLRLRPFTPLPEAEPGDFHEGIYAFAEPYVSLVAGPGNLARAVWSLPGFKDGQEQSRLTGLRPMWALGYGTLPPLTVMSPKSRLIDLLKDGHHDVDLSEAEMRLLTCWIDTWAHYRSLEDIRAIDDPDPRWFADYPNRPRMATAPVVEMEYAQDEFSSQADRLKSGARTAQANAVSGTTR